MNQLLEMKTTVFLAYNANATKNNFNFSNVYIYMYILNRILLLHLHLQIVIKNKIYIIFVNDYHKIDQILLLNKIK